MSHEQSELHQLRREAIQLQQRLDDLNRRLDELVARPAPTPASPQPPPPITQTEPPAPVAPPVIARPPPTSAPPPSPVGRPVPKESFEVRLGTYWLPRIGMAVLLTGMVFLVTWSYQYLGRGGKVALSYLCCAVLIGLGWWLERKMAQFGRILQAGGMALTYFITYAIHYSESLRVINSPAVALTLLGLVVAGIVVVADARKSALLAGMALFFGYYTSVISGVAPFTLASNAVLAASALWFLARNRWVPISYGAVLATYLTYMIWVWKLNRWGELDHLLWDAGYLSAADFRLRATFLSIYWLLFSVGGLILTRDAMNPAERNGLLTLNNVFFFVLFTLLMHHGHPDVQWQFQFCFGGALLVLSALTYQRFRPERLVMETLFLQGVAVATLGVLTYFKGVQLVGALSLESLFLLLLGRWMRMRWIAWIGRAAFTLVAVYAWSKHDDWDAPMRYGVWFAAAVGFVCARLEKHGASEVTRSEGTVSALYFAAVATALGMSAAAGECSRDALPWVWTIAAVVVGLLGGALRTREIVWSAHLPLLWSQGSFYAAQVDDREWALAPSLALIAVTFAFGLVWWSRARARDDKATASAVVWPYAALAVLAIMVTTIDHAPERWLFALFSLEGVLLLLAGHWLGERTFIWASHGPLAAALIGFFFWRLDVLSLRWQPDLLQELVLIVAAFAYGLLRWGRARADGKTEEATMHLCVYGLLAMVVVLVTTWDHCPAQWRLTAFAAETLALVLAGRFADEAAFVRLATVPMFVGAIKYLFAGSSIFRPRGAAWANWLVSSALLIVTDRALAKRQGARSLRKSIAVVVTVVALYALRKLVVSAYLTVNWAVLGFVLLALGFAVKERAWRLAGLVGLAFSLLRAVFYDLGRLETPYRILSFIGLGAILLVLAFVYTKNREKLAKWL